jgi:hypothetical protein
MEPTRRRVMQRRFVLTSAIALVVVAAFLPGSGMGSSAAVRGGQLAIPGGLADAIHARFGAGLIRQAAAAPPNKPEMGYSVALSADGTTALVAAPGLADDRGAVYVYHAASAGAWSSRSTPAATLKAPSARGIFGYEVVLSADGTTAFIGAPGANLSAGAVDVFHVSSEGSWASTSTPTATLTVAGASYLGTAASISTDGTTLAVGEPNQGSGAGAGYVFHASAEDAWTSTSTPTATLSNGSDINIAANVAISGDGTTVLLSDYDASDAGGAVVFHVASETGWVTSSSPDAILTDPGADEVFGYSVSLSGDGTTAVVGAPAVNHLNGAVDVFHVAAADAWATSSTPTAILTHAAGARSDLLGYVVSVSTDGSTVVATALGAAKLAGTVDVFHAADEGSWATTSTPTALLNEPTRHTEAELGRGLAISADGTTVLAGAPGFNWFTGDARVFHVADANSWVTSSHPAATLNNSKLPKPVCVVPRLKGESVSYAKFDLPYYDCSLGKVTRVHVKNKKWRKRVIAQSPAPGRHRHAGWKVKIQVGK